MLEVTFEESYLESRKISIDKENTSQTIVATICGDFLQEANVNAVGLVDDDVVALRYAYQLMPLFYELPAFNGQTIIVIISKLDLEQINYRTWKITATYDVPNNGGESGGGMGSKNIGNVGPDAGENDGQGWSENFTQLSVNLSASTRNVKMSRQVLSCARSFSIGAGNIPYPVGRPAPIGHTNDGIEGAEVYEREFGFNITAYMPPAKLKYAYIRRIANMHATMNRYTFFGFPSGSVLFLEMDFSGDLYQVVPVTFSFKQKNNFKFSSSQATQLAPPDIQGAYDIYYEPEFPDSNVHPGWADVDYRYLPVPDNGAVMVVQKPTLRVVHLNYEYSDFKWFEL